MRRALSLSLLLASCSTNGADTVINSEAAITSTSVDVDENALILAELDNGQPLLVRGDFKNVNALTANALAPALARVSTLIGVDSAELQLVDTERDELGFGHARYNQTAKGLPVVGGDLKIHVDASGRVYATSGAAGLTKGISAQPTLAQEDAHAIAADAARDGLSLSADSSRLVWVLANDKQGTHLAWEVTVTGETFEGPVRDLVYVDAHSGSVVHQNRKIHFARNRTTYDAKNKTSLPGTLARSEGSAAGNDIDINAAYDNTGITYDAYKTLFGRDSYDNKGATLKSTVHYDRNYVNAYWNGSQMVYGDGDNVDAIGLARSLDVTAHELTHAVTEYSSGLDYTYGDVGSMNEAMSDIFGAIVESWGAGDNAAGNGHDFKVDAGTWLVGEDIWTPATPNDALRYMDNPTKDNYSIDDYKSMNGNVEMHSGSGIGNLAFYLLVQGGKHPRGKSNVTVTGLGMDKASQIFYRAQTNYLHQRSNYPAWRAATVQAATDLYGAAEVASVNAAWSAVNVPGAGDTNPSEGDDVLVDGKAKTDISGSRSSKTYYKVNVPAGTTSLTVSTSGGSGDLDLYIRYNKQPGTWFFYDAKSATYGSSEEGVRINNPRAGTYWVLVKGATAYDGVSIEANY